jgi:beta-lactamase superfamily II metal-dependent hydrolase
MLRFLSKLLHIIILLPFFTWSISVGDLIMQVFKVGQGNFILITKSSCNNVLVVDCGVGDGYNSTGASGILKKNSSYCSDICTAFKNATMCKIVITHDHKDHKGGVKSLTDLIKIDKNSDFNVFQKDGWGNDNISGYLCNLFGNEVEFNVIRPDNFANTWLNPDEKHQNNLVLKITYKGKSILLPGDAGGALFAYHCINTGGFFDLFEDVAVFVLPHHGSWGNGEQFWLEAFLKQQRYNLKLFIISSDPKKSNNLPRVDYMTRILGNNSITNGAENHNICCSAPFKLEVDRKLEVDLKSSFSESAQFKKFKEITQNEDILMDIIGNRIQKIKPQSNSEKKSLKCYFSLNVLTNKLVFLTSCAQSCCYTVIIDDNGQIKVYDGEKLLFESFSNSVPPYIN